MVEATAIGLARLKLAAPDFKMVLPVTLTSPAPNELLLLTCTVPPPLNAVPVVPDDAGP